VTQTGREQVIHTFGPGESFGLVTALANAVNHTRFITLEESVIQKIPTNVIFNLIHENSAIAHQMIVYLSRNLSHMIELVEDLSLKSVESRLAKFIFNNAEDGVYVRKKWETQDMIASRIGTVPDVLSRIMRNFEDENIIRFDRQKITVIDLQALLAKIDA
jgi:CRP/FNR family transcriptional regulator